MNVSRTFFEILCCCNLAIWIMGPSGLLKMVPFESFRTVSYSHSILTVALSCIISKMHYIVKKSRFFILPLHLTPWLVVSGSSSEYWIKFGVEKLQYCGYSTVEKVDDVITYFDTIYEGDGQQDRQTDGQTPRDGIGRANA